MNKKEILKYLKGQDDKGLFKEADRVTRQYCGNKVFIRGIIEISNKCSRNCHYCGLRKDNKNIIRYKMTLDEVIDAVEEMRGKGIKTVVLQSGDDPCIECDEICALISGIKNVDSDMAVTLSLGEKSVESYKAFKKAGADRYLLKHETFNSLLYKKMHPGQNLDERVEALKKLKELGYQIGTGNIVGLPGQTMEDLADDIIFMKDLGPHMIGIGPFIPQSSTLLKGYPHGDPRLTLRVLALIRISLKYPYLPVTTALSSVLKTAQLSALSTSANVLMYDFTPEKYRENYCIYDNKIKTEKEESEKNIKLANKIPAYGRGDIVISE
ncbi:MAG: [FeFe] hydrogenase H-cluster radical SAM maturase HydE [Candidatus Omnitrophota bacterium]